MKKYSKNNRVGKICVLFKKNPVKTAFLMHNKVWGITRKGFEQTLTQYTYI